jgi:hypothetical protein
VIPSVFALSEDNHWHSSFKFEVEIVTVGRGRRWFPFFVKKRGEHRTISARLALWLECGIFTLILVIGVLGLGFLIARMVRVSSAPQEGFVVVWARISSKEIQERYGQEGPLYEPRILVEYQLGDKTFRAWITPQHAPVGGPLFSDRKTANQILQKFEIGEYRLVYVNPGSPMEAELPGEVPWWTALIAFIPISLIVLGGSGLALALLHGRSDHGPFLRTWFRRKHRSPPIEDGVAGHLWPTIPKPLSPKESPGVRLAIRLPARPVGLAGTLVSLLACMLWNAVSLTLVAWSGMSWWLWRADWSFFAFSLFLLLIGAFYTTLLLRHIVRQWALGITVLEISEQPLRPGHRYQVYLAQFGSVKVNRLSVSLVCEERAMFREGTETRVEVRQVQKLPLFRREAFVIRTGVPFEAFFELELPPRVMHSFISAHNQIAWALLLEEILPGIPPIRRYFPVVVFPFFTGKVSA